jgi:BirA family biotin operon repressor/biotin-[acetyl-CoA-carboxylase] ligase
MEREASLARALAARGATPLAGVEWHDLLGSTSDRLKELARRGAPEWMVVLADQQSAGRGREGRPWVSPRGGLYLSVLLRPRVAQLGLLPLAAGVAVVETAAEHGVSAQLKWPNDVLVGGRKLAGILAEAASGAGGAEWVVLGIGLNVALEARGVSSETDEQIAWLCELAPDAPADLPSVAATVLARLRVWYDALVSSPASIVGAWRERAVAWWGETIELRMGHETLRGRLLDVDEGGALLVATAGGRTQRVVSGEVWHVRREG